MKNVLTAVLVFLLAPSFCHAVWVRNDDNPVITGSPLVGSPVVLGMNGTYQMWYINDWSVSYASSTDALHWTAHGNTTGLSGGRQISLGTVLYNSDSGYKMWYSWGGDSGQTGYANSTDGINWNDRGRVLGPGPESYDAYAAELPHVLYDQSEHLYKMWYAAGESDMVGRKIAYATSVDGEHWSKHGIVFSASANDWCSYAVGSPYVEKTGNYYTMWFTGYNGSIAQIGHVNSTDGINWNSNSIELDLPVGVNGTWDADAVRDPWLLTTSDGRQLLYYSGKEIGDLNTDGIGIAFVPEPATCLLMLLGGLLIKK